MWKSGGNLETSLEHMAEIRWTQVRNFRNSTGNLKHWQCQTPNQQNTGWLTVYWVGFLLNSDFNWFHVLLKFYPENSPEELSIRGSHYAGWTTDHIPCFGKWRILVEVLYPFLMLRSSYISWSINPIKYIYIILIYIYTYINMIYIYTYLVAATHNNGPSANIYLSEP
jgi:hypothetical protein